jgi:hypothetical protein
MTDTSVTTEAPLANAPGAPAMAPPSYLSKYSSQMEDLQAQDQQAFDKEQSSLAPRYDALSKSLSGGIPKPPDQQKVEPPPDPASYRKDAQSFASAMAVLGAVAGRFTRHAGNASLNAFAAAIKGWQTGNLQAYEQETKKWQEATEQTVKNNQMVLEKYKQVLENRKLNIDEQMANIQLIASQYHDKMTFDAAAAKNYTLVAQIYEKNQQYTDKVQTAAQKLQAEKDKQDATNHSNVKWLASPQGQAYVSTLPPEEQVKYRGFIEQYGQGANPATVHEVASLIGEGKMAPLTGFALRSPFGQAVMADVGARYPNYAGTEYATQSSAARAVGSRAGQITVSSVEADKTFDLARQASAAFPRGQFVPLNRIYQMGEQAKSNPQYRQFMAANEAAVTAYGATMSRSGVNTVAAQQRAHQVLDTADSQEAYTAGLDQLQKEVNAVRDAPGQAAKEVRQSLQNPDAPGAPGNPVDKAGWSIQEVK